MPLDDRLRTAFDRAASSIEPDTEMRLDQTLRRGARPRQQFGLGGLVAAAAGLAVLVVIVRLVGIPSVGPVAPSPTPPASAALLAGSYTTTLLPSDPGIVVDGIDLAGRWEISLLANGVIELAPPASFTGSRAEGHTFTVDGQTLRTDLYFNDYCDSVGEYTWAISDELLTLTVADDGCDIRRGLLATHAWDRIERPAVTP
jgi:hypothetical protein